MPRRLLLIAFLCLTPMLFMSMNGGVHPTAKIICKTGSGVFLVLAAIAYGRAAARSG